MKKPRGPSLQKLGRYISRDSIVLERLLPASVEVVWNHLTNSSRLARWLAGGKVDLRHGGAVNLDFDLIECPGREEMHGTMTGIITAYDPPNLLAYTWGENEARMRGVPDSLVTFELRPATDGQTLLKLTHTRIAPQDMSPVAAGWHTHLDVLGARLAGREPASFSESYHSVAPEYRKLLESPDQKPASEGKANRT